MDGTRWTMHDARWTVDGTRWTAHGGRYTVDGARWTVDDARYTVDGQPISGTYTICHSTLRNRHLQLGIGHWLFEASLPALSQITCAIDIEDTACRKGRLI